MNGADATAITVEERRTWKDIIAFILSELKPRGKMLTPFNVISGVTIVRELYPLIAKASRYESFRISLGIWIGFDVMVGVAFAGGVCSDLRGLCAENDKYHSIRATV
jgi:hypothetical protein